MEKKKKGKWQTSDRKPINSKHFFFGFQIQTESETTRLQCHWNELYTETQTHVQNKQANDNEREGVKGTKKNVPALSFLVLARTRSCWL